jgi:hypothetical protein
MFVPAAAPNVVTSTSSTTKETEMAVIAVDRSESVISIQRTQGTRKLALRGLAAVAIAASVALAAAGPAAAYSGTGSGQPGAVVVPFVQGTHLPTPTLMTQGMVAERSAASTGTQYIRAAYRVYRWNGSSWVYKTGSTVAATLPAGYSKVTMPAWSVSPTSGIGYYYVETTVTWQTGAGAVLGTMNIFWTGPRDYQCATYLPCTPGPGWIYLG